MGACAASSLSLAPRAPPLNGGGGGGLLPRRHVQILQAFLVATVCVGVLLVLLLYANVVLLVYHAPTTKRSVDQDVLVGGIRGLTRNFVGPWSSPSSMRRCGRSWCSR